MEFLDSKQVVQFNSFKYLRSCITSAGRCTGDVTNSIAQTKSALKKKSSGFQKRVPETRNKCVEGCIWSVCTYGSEIWTLRKEDRSYLEVSDVVLDEP